MRIFRSFQMHVCVLVCLGMCGTVAHAAATSTALAASASSASVGTAITLTATVTSGGSSISRGSVTFCDTSISNCTNDGMLGKAQVNSSGVAKWKYIPPVASHTYIAVYTGNSTYGASFSSSVSVSITGLRATTSVLTSSGSAGNYTLQTQVSTISNNNTAPSGSVTFQDTTNSNYTLGTVTLGSATTTPGFGSAVTNSLSGGTPRQSATGDFNGDGIPDLAIPSGNVYILLGSANGTFSVAPGSPISMTSTTVQTVTGDFNNDGKLDVLVSVWGSGAVDLLTGNGDGTFTNTGNISTVSQASSLGVGDFNNDGNLDFAVTSQNGGVVGIYLGNGSGGFTSTGTTYSTGSNPYSIAVADYNGDGYADLAIGNSNASSVTVLLNNGSGGFTAAPGSPVTTGSQVWSLVTTDLNNDGKPDLVTADKNDNNIGVLLGNGDGTFATLVSYSVASGVKTVATADFDRDGYQDVAVCNFSTSTVSIFPGSSNGTLGTARSYTNANTGCEGMVTGDWNGDGLPDIHMDLASGTSSANLLNKQTQTATATLSSVSVPGNGSHTVQAAYGGDSLSATSTSNSLSLTASPITTTTSLGASPTTSQWGQQVLLSAYVSPYQVGGLAPTGNVTYKNGGTTLGSGAVIGSGYSQLNTTSLPIGSNSLTAIYAGDSNFLTSTSSAVTVTVSQATGTISIASSNTGQPYGTSLTFTATLPSAATGTVTFTDGGNTIGTGSASSGTATLNLSNLSVGSHTIGASYGGDAHYTSATASTITVTVVRAAATLLGSASRNPAIYGDAVTLSFTCSGGAATPTGTLVLKDGSTTLATLTLNGSGTTSYLTSAFVAGSHSLTATYSGDTNYY